MWLRRACLASAMAMTALVVVPSSPAAAAIPCGGSFCAYDLAGLEGPLMRSSAPAGSEKVEVPDDRTSSGENNTVNQWVGVNRRFLLPDSRVHRWFPGDIAFELGAEANNKIDHFDVE